MRTHFGYYELGIALNVSFLADFEQIFDFPVAHRQIYEVINQLNSIVTVAFAAYHFIGQNCPITENETLSNEAEGFK